MSLYAKEYSVIITVLVIETPVTKFLPFTTTDFSDDSGGWADRHLFKVVVMGKLFQTLVSSVVQIAVLGLTTDIRNVHCQLVIYLSATTSIF